MITHTQEIAKEIKQTIDAIAMMEKTGLKDKVSNPINIFSDSFCIIALLKNIPKYNNLHILVQDANSLFSKRKVSLPQSVHFIKKVS